MGPTEGLDYWPIPSGYLAVCAHCTVISVFDHILLTNLTHLINLRGTLGDLIYNLTMWSNTHVISPLHYSYTAYVGYHASLYAHSHLRQLLLSEFVCLVILLLCGPGCHPLKCCDCLVPTGTATSWCVLAKSLLYNSQVAVCFKELYLGASRG